MPNVMQFGKYKGLELSAVPTEYIEWLLASDEKKVMVYKTELERRKLIVENSVMAAIVSAGVKSLLGDPVAKIESKRLHMAKQMLMDAIKDAAQPKEPAGEDIPF